MRKIALRIHKYLSFLIFIPIIVVSLTGAILVYKYEIDNLSLSNALSVKKERSISLDILKEKINKNYPNYEIVGWLLPEDDTLAHQIYLIKHNEKEKNLLYINQYTGTLLNTMKERNKYFTGFIDELHTSLFLKKYGTFILSIIGFIFCLVALSGIIIYKNFWKNFFKLNFNKKTKIYFSSFHKTIGIISSPILLIIVSIGTYWSVNSSLDTFKKEPRYIVKPNLYNANISLDALYKQVNIQLGENTLHYISFPYKEKWPISFYAKLTNDNILYDQYANIVRFDKHTGELVSTFKIKEQDLKKRFFNTFRKVHYGYYNEFTKFIWFLLALSPLLLSISGLSLMYKKRNKTLN